MKNKPISKVCFLHIPKTAGTTVTHLIGRNYKEEEIARIYFRGKHQEAIAIALAEPKKKIVFGHYTLAEVPAAEQLYHFTFLRHPLPRTVSHFLHLKYSPDPQHKQMMEQAVDFPGFLKIIQGNNLQTRRLVNVYAPKFDQMPEKEILEMATNNLDWLSFVGISERFNESISVVAHDLGWKFLAHKNQNKSGKKEEARELKYQFGDAILEANQLDLALYCHAQKMLDDRLKKLSIVDFMWQKTKFLR